MKRQRTILLVILLFLVYVAYRMAKSSQIVVSEPMPDDTPSNGDMAIQNTIPGARVGGCVKPLFGNEVSYSGRDCAGTVINENRMLALGDQGCEVLLLQQRLNAMQNDRDILKPTGKFGCRTLAKLRRLMNVDQISLNLFSPDEQVGFDEFRAGTKVTNYSYMDTLTYKK
jgi:hypothetical protein